MAEALAIFGAVGNCIARTKELLQAIDLVIGCYTGNTPVADLWHELLSGLRTEIFFAESQLCSAKYVLEQRRGPGADAANRRRQELKFDKLIEELIHQIKASEDAFLTATNQFKDQGVFGWALLEAAGTKARNAVAPVKSHSEELTRIRWRVNDARESIMNAFILNSHDSTGSQFPTLESLGNIRDELAHQFLRPDPFCKKFETEDDLASGLLLCNRDDLTLEALQRRIQQTGHHWVQQVGQDAANRHDENCWVDGDAASTCDQDHTSTVAVLEECRDKILVQLKGVFKAITNVGAPFTRKDYNTATRGKCTLEEWSWICLAADGGIVIALGGKMSAGKSSILNAMLGQPLLPTAKMVCTAVPSRLRHVSGQIEPALLIPWIDPYVECLEWIKAQELSNNYRDSLLPKNKEKWAAFTGADPDGCATLTKIETNQCPMLKKDTVGKEAIDQMAFLNALLRICRRFGKEVDMGYPNDWPIFSVEFTGLKYYCQSLPGPFTLLDLPGYNENIKLDTARFNELMRRAAKQADVIVPVIAGPTIARTRKWTEAIIRPEWKRKISAVIITKRDLIRDRAHVRRYIPDVATNCNLRGREDCILLCDTPQGMAAMQLQLLLDAIERNYAANPIPPEATAETNNCLQQEVAIVIAGITDKLNPFHRLFDKGSVPDQFTAFTLDDWRELVDRKFDSSHLCQTCDKFAANTIEDARMLRLVRFIKKMEKILKELVSSLSITLGENRVSLDGNRASLDELYQIQCQTKTTMSDLQRALDQWTPCSDEMRAQQESKLNALLLRFEGAAKDGADEAIASSVALLDLDGGAYLLGKDGKGENIVKACRETVLRRLTHVVDDTIQDLSGIWKENQNIVLSRLRNATVKIKTHPQLARLVENTIDELEKVKQLDPEKLRITVSGTPGEVVVGATRKRLWHQIRMRAAALVQTTEEDKPTGLLSRLMKQTFGRFGGPKAIEPQSTPPTSAPVLFSSTDVARPEASVANGGTTSAPPATNFACLEVAMFPVNMVDALRDSVSELHGSGLTLQEIAEAVKGGPSDNEPVEDLGPLKLSQEVLRKCVLATTLEPLVSRVKARAQLSMTESLNQMGVLARQAVLGALKEYYDNIERQLRAQGSEDYQQFRAETLERLTCWGNLVAALGAIKEMKKMLKEPEDQVTSPRSSSTLVESRGSSSPSLRSPSITSDASSDTVD